MQRYRNLVLCTPVQKIGVLCLLVTLRIHSLNDGLACYVSAKAVNEVKRHPKCNQLLLRDHSASARLPRTFGSPAAISDLTNAKEGRGDLSHFPDGNFAVDENDGFNQFGGDDTLPVDTHRTTHLLYRLFFTRHRGNPAISQKGKVTYCGSVHSEPKRALTQKKYCVRAAGNVDRKDNREGRLIRSKARPEEKDLQPQKKQSDKSCQQPAKHQRQPQGQKKQQLASSGKECHGGKSHHLDRASLREREAEGEEKLFKSNDKEQLPCNTGGRRLSPVSEEDLKLKSVGDLAEFLVKRRTAEAVLENEWKLIEESWKRAELFYDNVTAFSASGFRSHRQKNGHRVILAVLPFWKVDLPGALQDMTKTAAWRVFGAPASSATRPVRVKTGNGGNDTLVQIGYYPSWLRNTYTFGWNDTQITYSTGVDPTEAWPLERVGGNATSLPVGHLMEVTSRNGGGKAFHDFSSRFYGHEVNVGDVGVGITHQFYNDTYDATPSNIIVRGQNYSVDIGADPADTSYRVGVGNDETMITVLRDFDERRTAFRGDFMDWAVSWNSDAQDANSSALSADTMVGSKNEEPFLTASVHKGVEEDYAQGDTQIQMKDLGMRMHWREAGLTGDITLGKIKYKFDMKEGLPDFTLTAS